MRILIIEDNSVIAKVIERNLRSNYAIDICETGEEGLIQAEAVQYDTILLDLNLPGISGSEVCQVLRKQKITTPIIVLSGVGEIKSKVEMLNMGADDYMTKPFHLFELHARIQVAMRHISNNSPNGKLCIADIELDSSSRIVKRGETFIELRRKEFDLLEYLMRNQGRTLTRTMILEHIWDMNENLWANVIDVHIKHLRDKIDRPFGSNLIKTVHGLGYTFQPNQAVIA